MRENAATCFKVPATGCAGRANPADFRGLTFLRINPNRTKQSQVDCTAIFEQEQWYLPETDEVPTVKARDLVPLTDIRYYPVELLLRITQASPGGTLRLKRTEIGNQHSGLVDIRDVELASAVRTASPGPRRGGSAPEQGSRRPAEPGSFRSS